MSGKMIEIVEDYVERWQDHRNHRLGIQKAARQAKKVEDAELKILIASLGDADSGITPSGIVVSFRKKRLTGYTVPERTKRVLVIGEEK